MKTFQCIFRSGNSGKEAIILTRAVTSSDAVRIAKPQAKAQLGSSCGACEIVKVTEVK